MNLSIFDLTDKVAIVTGGSRGIGKAIALAFAQAGADVVVAARSADAIKETAAQIRKEGRKSLAVPTDVRSIDQIKNLLRQTLDLFGSIDILVNNAGGDSGGGGYVLEMSIDDWRDGIDLNLNSLFYCSKIIGEVMVRQKSGNIINISSGMGFGPFPGASHHAAAKAGVINFTKSLALEWAPYNIRVNSLAPGITETELTSKHWQEHPEHLETTLKNVPVGRIAQPEEMAAVAIFLASPAASYITGETIYVSGGLFTTVPPTWDEYYLREKSGARLGDGDKRASS
jgi:NAD(P)-dependent dehydrogenase (short-subunit alcohol dehydrogenase family)